MTYIQLGRITIPALWLTVIVAFIFIALVYRVVNKKSVEEWYWNSLFLYIVVWKLSYIVFHFSFFLDMPLSILYFNGGMRGHIFGLAAVTFYVIFIAWKKYASIQREFPILFLFFFLGYETLLNLMQLQYIEGIAHLILLLVYSYYVNWLRKKQLPLSTQAFLMLLLSELFVITLFGSFISIEVLTFLWLAAIAFLFIQKKWRSA